MPKKELLFLKEIYAVNVINYETSKFCPNVSSEKSTFKNVYYGHV